MKRKAWARHLRRVLEGSTGRSLSWRKVLAPHKCLHCAPSG